VGLTTLATFAVLGFRGAVAFFLGAMVEAVVGEGNVLQSSRVTSGAFASTSSQGLTLVQFSAQLEPCLKQQNTLHSLNTP